MAHPAGHGGDGDHDEAQLDALHEALLGANAAGVERKSGGGPAGAAAGGREVIVRGRQGVATAKGLVFLKGGSGGDDALEAMDFLLDFGGAAPGAAGAFGFGQIETGEEHFLGAGASGADAFVGHESGGVRGR